MLLATGCADFLSLQDHIGDLNLGTSRLWLHLGIRYELGGTPDWGELSGGRFDHKGHGSEKVPQVTTEFGRRPC